MASIPFDESPNIEESKGSSIESQAVSPSDEIPTLEETSSLSSEEFHSEASSSSDEIPHVKVSGSLSPKEMIERLQTSKTFDEGKDSGLAENPMKLDDERDPQSWEKLEEQKVLEDVNSKENQDGKLDSLNVVDDDKKSEKNEQDYLENKIEENEQEYSLDKTVKTEHDEEEMQENKDQTPQMYVVEQEEPERNFDHKPTFEIQDVAEEDGILLEVETSPTEEDSPISETEPNACDAKKIHEDTHANPEMSSMPVSVLYYCEDSSNGLKGQNDPDIFCESYETRPESQDRTESDNVGLSREAAVVEQGMEQNPREAEMQKAEAVAANEMGSEVTDQDGNVSEESYSEDGKQIEDIDSNVDLGEKSLSLQVIIDSVPSVDLGMDQHSKEENSTDCGETEHTNQVIGDVHFVYRTVVAEAPQEAHIEDVETIEDCDVQLAESVSVTEVCSRTIAGVVINQSIERAESSSVMDLNQYVCHQGTETATELASHIDGESEMIWKQSESRATEMDETSENVVGRGHRVEENLCDIEKQQSNDAPADEKFQVDSVVRLNQTQIKSTVLKDSEEPHSVGYPSDNGEKIIVMNNRRATIFLSQIPGKVLGDRSLHLDQASQYGYTKTRTEIGQAYGDGDSQEARASFWNCCCFLRWLRPHQD